MNPAPLLSIVSGLLCLLLSVIFYFKNGSVQTLSEELQKQQDTYTSEQRTFQTKQQLLAGQQQALQQTQQLQQQIGPAVLQDLGSLAHNNKNEKIEKLLLKYDIKISKETPKPAGNNPAPAPTTPASTPKPADAPRLQ